MISVSHSFAFEIKNTPSEKVTLSEQEKVKLTFLKSMEHELFTNPWEAFQKLLTLQAPSEKAPNELRYWWLIRKAQCQNLLYFYEDFDQTLVDIEKLSIKEAPEKVQALFFQFQGLSLQRNGKYIDSRVHFRKSMAIAKKANLFHLYITAKQELAYTYSLVDMFETSLKDMQEAYLEAFSLDDHFLLAIINETYGAIYGYIREYDKSVEYYQKALSTYENLGYKSHVAEAIYGLASTYRYAKNYPLAVEYFKLYQKKVAYTPNANITYFGAYGLGMSLAEKGACEEALPVIERAFELKGLDDYDAELYKRQASCFIQLNQYESAEVAISKAETIFNSLPELLGTAWQLEVVKIKADLANAIGDTATAYILLKTYHEKYTKVLIDNSSTHAANLRANMELERLNIEKALSSQRSKTELLEIKAKEQENLQQSYFIIFLLTSLLIFISVVTVQYRTNRKVTKLSNTDALSGLFNRRYIFNYLEQHITPFKKERKPLSIFVLDIDDFKIINDTYGHPVGDKVILEVANIAKSTLREHDLIGRIGGEEFICILPNTEINIAEAIAENMRKRIAQHSCFLSLGSNISLTVSVGVSCVTEETLDTKALYHIADKALYAAKNSGKNCVVTLS